ncbi:hypothetical protein HHI36_003012 [Cryptolaemus montrouzieri]|uniref:Carbonyl reductase n=1 Tax=Cryptolaemus montrouzieri TaxID=559131 RepID=A0ABD2PC73_9CUCU
MTEKIAVVTGGNKGIGYAIVKGLCERYDGTVYLTARDIARGEAALSINTFKDHLKKTHTGIDILVNNAAIAFKHDATDPFSLLQFVEVCNTLFPLIKQNGRVVNIKCWKPLM